MNRRDFTGTMAALLASRPGVGARQAGPRVNGARLLERLRGLARFGANPDGGVSRLAYSEADRAGRQYVMGLMRQAGLDVSIDTAGNLIGRRPGSDPGLGSLMFGSHIDSVPHGGNYDGPVGSMGAIEVAHSLRDYGVVTRHPLEVVAFQNEEGGKTGSRAMSGELTEADLDFVTGSGKTVREGIAAIGGDPTQLERALRGSGDIAAYLELHVEQGAVLEREGIDIGVVEGIVGIKRWAVTIDGFANHAGTTPMEGRQDALLAAARFIEAVHDTVRRLPGTAVGTVGRIEAHPGAPNVIPGRVALSLELRDLRMATIDSLYTALEMETREIARATDTRFRFEQFYVSRAAPTDERLRDVVADVAGGLGLSALRMPSGAGHDAQSIALLAPVGMIFVPSVGGISHSPQEFTRPEHVIHGAQVLLHAVLRVDRAWG